MTILTKSGTPCSPSNCIAVAAAAVAVFAAGYTTLHRPHAGNSSVAFVNLAAIMEQSEAGKSLAAQITPKQQALQKEAQAKVEELKKEQSEMNKQGESPEKMSENNAALQKKLNDWNAEAQKRDAAIKTAANPAVQKIQDTLREQLAKIAAEHKFTAILPLQEAFYADKDMDVTQEAIQHLNAQLPKVDVQFERK